jgi:Sap, sulfolipid-1-addressing protein
MDSVILWAFLAALNPTLLAATTVMLLLPSPKRLLLGYLAGAAITSVTLGMVIVFSLEGSGAVGTAKHTLSPATDLALGALALLASYVLRPSRPRREGGRWAERRHRREEKKRDKGPPRWQRTLSRGTARTTFLVGILLTLPGGSYLVGLDHIADRDASTVATAAMVLGFNVIMLALLELPLIGYTFAPDWTPQAVERFKNWLSRNGRRIAVRGLAAVGVLLIVRGVIELLS